jgi:hypothetical protein
VGGLQAKTVCRWGLQVMRDEDRRNMEQCPVVDIIGQMRAEKRNLLVLE